MNSDNIVEYIMSNFDDIVKIQAWGETSFFYNPNNIKVRSTYFCTIKDKDGEWVDVLGGYSQSKQ